MSAVACSACYGSGYGVDEKPCPCGCRPRPAPAIVPPVAAGSVDTPAFREKLSDVQSWASFGVIVDQKYGQLVAHINAWGAQQREAGRQEGKASNETLLRASVNEMDAMERERDEARQRAEKAEAELDTLKESLRLVNVDHGLWMARTHAAEDARDDALARVKELEAKPDNEQ